MARRKPPQSHDKLDDPSELKPLKKTKGDAGLVIKLVIFLSVVGVAVGLGAYFHKKQSENPLGYEYFKKRGYDKIKELGPQPDEPPKSSQEDDMEDAKIKAQRNIFLQD